MSNRALNAWMRDEVRLGGQAGLTVLMLGSNAAASTTANLNVDVIAWAKSKGAYAGLTLEGSIIRPRREWNVAYHGRQLTPVQILNMRDELWCPQLACPAFAAALRAVAGGRVEACPPHCRDRTGATGLARPDRRDRVEPGHVG